MNEVLNQPRLAWGVDEIAAGTPLCSGFVRGQIKSGALKAKKFGTRLLILDEDLRAWLGQASTAAHDRNVRSIARTEEAAIPSQKKVRTK